MTDIVDLNEVRNSKAMPDDDCMSRDEYGRPLFTFLAEYEADGSRFNLEILAYNEEEAVARIEGIKASLTYTGKLFSKIIT